MKLTKKSISILLVAIMLIACAIPVFAQTKSGETEFYVHVNNPRYIMTGEEKLGGWFRIFADGSKDPERVSYDSYFTDCCTYDNGKVVFPISGGMAEMDFAKIEYVDYTTSNSDELIDFTAMCKDITYNPAEKSYYILTIENRLAVVDIKCVVLDDLENGVILNNDNSNIAAIEFDENGQLYGIIKNYNKATIQLAKIDTRTGETTIIADICNDESLVSGEICLEYDKSNDVFYALEKGNKILYRINKTTGEITKCMQFDMHDNFISGLIITENVEMNEQVIPRSNGNIYGFMSYCDGSRMPGWVNFNASNPEFVGSNELSVKKYSDVNDATVLNGYAYFVSYRYDYLCKADIANDFNYEMINLNKSISDTHIAADEKTGLLYISGTDGGNYAVYEYNIETGIMNEIIRVAGWIKGIEVIDGRLYMLNGGERDVRLCYIEFSEGKEKYELDDIATVGEIVETNYYFRISQSIAYDKVNETLYYDIGSQLYKIDIKTAKCDYIGHIGSEKTSVNALFVYNESDESEYKKGDANGDNIVDSADATTVLRYVAKLENLSEAKLKAGDVNGDDEVDSSDATVILRFVAGLENIG